MRGALFLAALGLAAGCTVPSLAELEAQRARSCNADHPCISGYSCVASACVANGALECNPGSTSECGSTVGACLAGTRTCSEEGKPGACVGEVGPVEEVCNGKDDDCNSQTDEGVQGPVCALTLGVCAGKRAACAAGTLEQPCGAASYGADHEGTETRCDGKDNDCDGQTDEALTSGCAKQQGVCLGAKQACSGGSYPACTAATYQAFATAYEPFEGKCDGLDNDCDGLSDRWTQANLSQSAELSRRAVAVPVGSSALVLYEEGAKLTSKLARADGTFGPPHAPSATLAGAIKAYAPALANDGDVIAAAWIEERPAKVVELATLDADGGSTLPGAGAMQILSTGAPAAVSIALDASAGRVLVAIEDASSPSTVKLVGYPSALPPAGGAVTFTRDLAAPGGRAPHVAAGSGGTFFVVFEDPVTGIERRTVDASGVVSKEPTVGGPGDRNPQVFALSTGVMDTAIFFLSSPSLSGDQLAQVNCGASTCGAVQLLGEVGTGMKDLRLAAASRGDSPTLAVWDEGLSSVAVRYRVLSGAGPAASQTLSAPGSIALRPFPVLFPGLLGAVAFDSEGNTGGGVPGNEVFVSRLCAQ